MSRPRRILATSGGFLATDRYRVMRPAGLVVKGLVSEEDVALWKYDA